MAKHITLLYTFTVPANGQVTRAAWGDFVRIQSITTGQTILVKTDVGDSIPMTLGQKFRFPIAHPSFNFVNTTGAPIALSVLIGVGDFEDQQVTGAVSVSGATTPLPTVEIGGRIETLAPLTINAGANTQIFPNNANRQLCWAMNPVTSGRILIINIYDAGIAGFREGFYLEPGDRLELNCRSELIYGYNPGPGNLTVLRAFQSFNPPTAIP